MDKHFRLKVLLISQLLIIAFVFGVSYTQYPLYFSNQNTYFLQGLANGGLGFLANDWLANTTDPFPVFSLMVTFTYSKFPNYFFYIYYIIILGIYILSIAGIISRSSILSNSRLQFFIFIVLITFLHSMVFRKLGKLVNCDIGWLMHAGLAGQYILGRVFQPSVFGVLLILSIYLFLKHKPFLSVLFSSLAAIFHSSYLLVAAILTISYMIIIYRENKRILRAVLLGLWAFLLVLPNVIYVYVNFNATSQDSLSQAQNILVNYHIPEHAKVESWFNVSSVFQLTIILISLFIVRNKRLFTILFFSFCMGVLMTLIQVLTDNNFLALLFPWRISVVLIPLSSSLLLASIVSFCYRKFLTKITNINGIIKYGFTIATILLLFSGIITTYFRFHKASNLEDVQMISFLSKVAKPTDVFLIPLDMQRFRLQTGIPIFVDNKSHPFKDTEVIEWYKRSQLARKFYTDKSCTILNEILSTYRITHIVFKKGDNSIDCDLLSLFYKDESFVIYEIRSE